MLHPKPLGQPACGCRSVCSSHAVGRRLASLERKPPQASTAEWLGGTAAHGPARHASPEQEGAGIVAPADVMLLTCTHHSATHLPLGCCVAGTRRTSSSLPSRLNAIESQG